MNSIIYDDKIIIPEYNKCDYYYNFTERLDKRDCVKLSLFCAKISNFKSKESNACIGLVEKWLVDEKSASREELLNAADVAYIAYSDSAAYATCTVVCTADAAASYDASSAAYNASSAAYNAASAAYNSAVYATNSSSNVVNINEYLQILLRKTKQFQNNKILEQISKTDVDKLELVDWNMITDIMQEEYNIIHEFDYENIFSRRCLIELLRREYL